MLAASQLPLRCFDIGAGAASVALARCVGLAASGAQRRAHNFDDENHLAYSPPEPFSRGWAAGGSQSAVFGNSIGDRPVAPRKKLLRALALLRSPHELDGEGLGRAATSAARDGLDDDDWWNAVVKRTKELAPRLALHDVTLILNGMARMRRLDRDLLQVLLPRICSHLVYLSSSHLAMLSSAMAKADVHDQKFVELLTRELKARLMEFHSSMEITMIVNAVSKLRVTDDDLYRRFVTCIQSRMSVEAFHVRDLSVIVGALARVHCTDAATVGRFADCAVQTLPQATPLELARLMHACMSVACSTDGFFKACVLRSRELASEMDPSGLSSAAFSFGQCLEVAEMAHLPYLRKIFRHIRLASVTSLPLFSPREIVSLLRTYSRWQITFDIEHLRRVAARMKATSSQFDVESAVSGLSALALLMQRNSVRSAPQPATSAAWEAVGDASHPLFQVVWKAASAGSLDLASLVRVLDASTVLRPADPAPFRAVQACVLRRRHELDTPLSMTLCELLSMLGCKSDDDIMLALADNTPQRL